MLQKFKITSYAFIVVFMTVQVFTIPASGTHNQGARHLKSPQKPDIVKSTMPKIEGEREMAVEPAKESERGAAVGERIVQNEAIARFHVAYQRVIDCTLGLSAYISAMTEQLTWLQTQQDAFNVRIEECALDRHQPHEAPPNCEARGELYWGRQRLPQMDRTIPRDMVHAIRAWFQGAEDGIIPTAVDAAQWLRFDVPLSTACMWQGDDPQDHYR